jgi:L-arabinose isomerase
MIYKEKKTVTIPYSEYVNMLESFKTHNEIINGSVVFQSQIDWSLKFYSRDEGLKIIREAYDKDVDKFLKESSENYQLNNELRKNNELLKKNIKQKKYLYAICVLALLWSIFVTIRN